MRRRQLAALLGAAILLTLCACGKKKTEQEPETPTPAPTVEQTELSLENLGAVSAMTKELSAAQMELITGSIEVSGDEAQSGGVTACLMSAMGDGCFNCFNVSVSLPEKVKSEKGGYGFQSAEILFNDPNAPFKTTAQQWTVTDDEDAADSRYTLRLTVGASRWDSKDYALNNGTVRTLKLKNIVSDEGKVLYEGEWSFSFTYAIVGEYVELIDEPIAVPGVSASGRYGEKDWAEISSFVLSNFSAECRYRLLGEEVSEPYSYGLAYVEMKSGEKHLIGCDDSRVEGESDVRDYYLVIPIPLDEVKTIHLTDHVSIEVG